MKRLQIGFVISALFAFTSASALAEEKQGVAHQKKSDGYGYIFSDDLLDGNNKGAMDAQIRVLNLGRRDRLLRPRTHFVPEMLKSVESL